MYEIFHDWKTALQNPRFSSMWEPWSISLSKQILTGTCVKVNFSVWVKRVPLVSTSPPVEAPPNDCSSSARSDVERVAPCVSGRGWAAALSCSSIRFCSRAFFLDRYSWRDKNNKSAKALNHQMKYLTWLYFFSWISHSIHLINDDSSECALAIFKQIQHNKAQTQIKPCDLKIKYVPNPWRTSRGQTIGQCVS